MTGMYFISYSGFEDIAGLFYKPQQIIPIASFELLFSNKSGSLAFVYLHIN